MTELLKIVVSGELDQTRAKEVLDEMVSCSLTLDAATEKLGIKKVDKSEIDSLCQQLIDENPEVVHEVKTGNTKAVGALIGKARTINANANPGLVRKTILQMIGE